MKQQTAIAVLVLGLAACAEDTRAPDAAAPEPAAPVAEAAAPAGVNAVLAQPLPEGVDLDIPVRLRRDRTYTDEDGAPRRRVVLELADGGAAPSFEVIERAFVDAGFNAGNLRESDDGNAWMRFRKDSYGVVVVSVRPDWGKTSGDPESRIVVLDLRPDAAATP